MSKKAFSVVLIVLFISNLTSVAQKNWNLKQCIDYALEHNIQIKQEKLNTEIASNSVTSARAAVLPDLYAGTDFKYTTGRAVDPYTNEISEDNNASNNLYLQSRVTLFNGLQNYNTVKQRELELLSSLQDVEKAKNDIVINVATTYLDILLAQELHKVSQQQYDITKQQVERTNKLVEAGRSARGALLEIQAQLEQEELTVINAENQITLAYLRMTQLLELDSIGDFLIETPNISLDENILIDPVDVIYQEAITYLPEVKSAELALQGKEKGVLIAKGRYSPELSARGTYYTGYSDQRSLYNDEGNKINYPYGDQLKDNARKEISLSLTIPIFTRLQTNMAVSNAKISKDVARNNLNLQKNKVRKDIQEAHAKAQSAMKDYVATEKAVASTREAFNYAQEKYNVGLINSVEYQTAKNRLHKIESDLIQAKYEFFFRKTILEFFRGKPISFGKE